MSFVVIITYVKTKILWPRSVKLEGSGGATTSMWRYYHGSKKDNDIVNLSYSNKIFSIATYL